MTQDADFLELLRATFKVEAAEHVQAIASGLLQLEQAPAPQSIGPIVEVAFRAAHSLKGAARAVDFTQIEALCQALENSLAACKRETSVPSASALDTLHGLLDAISAALLAGPAAPAVRVPAARPLFATPERPLRQPDRSNPVAAVQRPPPPAGQSPPPSAEQSPPPPAGESPPPPAGQGPPPPAAQSAPAPAAQSVSTAAAVIGQAARAADPTVRVSVAKLDTCLMQAEEMLSVKLSTGQRAHELRVLARRVEAWREACAAVEPQTLALRQPRDPSAGGSAAQRQDVLRLLTFFDWNLGELGQVETQLAALTRTAEQDGHVAGRLVNDLLEDSKKLLLLPFATLAAPLPKLVRDLCRDQGKQAELKVIGEDVEIDKRILEEMKDPLLHLLRNSVDHGIEPPEERGRRGKPARATITLAVSRVNGSKVQLLLSDDGSGIDAGKVKAVAVQRGMISAEAAARLDETAARALIFQSDLSTSPIITELSGRGLGLAIVREKVEKLGGEVSVDSRVGAGTSFRIVVPATRATFRGVVVEAGGQVLVVPTSQVERVARIRPDDLQTVEGRETISLDSRAVSLVGLAEVLELPPPTQRDDAASGAAVLVLGTGDERIAFRVDAVLDEQEVLVKPLTRPLSRVRNIAAATLLGSGRIAPILNVTDLLKSARKRAVAPLRPIAAAKPALAKRVLVAEDSITSRMLLKGILESAGFRVQTAVDGIEALTLLRAEPFDLLVSDVEMPRLNGFDLTARIRADKTLAELPVVLVTALETRQDREHGIDAGANAYIVKGSFDQSNLLEAVQRLI